jgi:hypothetical protein
VPVAAGPLHLSGILPSDRRARRRTGDRPSALPTSAKLIEPMIPWRPLLLSATVLGVGVFLIAAGIRSPDAHTLRGLVVGALATAVGLAGIFVSFRQS